MSPLSARDYFAWDHRTGECDSGDAPTAAAPGSTTPVLSRQHATATSALDDSARQQHATPVSATKDLRADVWDSDEELDEFLVDWRAARSSLPS